MGGEGKGRVWEGREIGKRRGEKGAGEGGKEEPADFRYSLRYSPPQMLDLSGRLAGRGVQRRGEKGRGRKERERER